jgi:hypothetical protein
MIKLNATQIGYLRHAPPSDKHGAIVSGPNKAMLRKLAKSGYVEEFNDRFRRSADGDAAVANFDATISEPCRAVLTAIRAGKPRIADMKGVNVALASGLAVIGIGSGSFFLTEQGKNLADPIGEEGYFSKSGNLVKLVSVDDKGNFHVERVDGDSAGKGMSIPRDSFISKEQWARNVAS